MTWAMPTYTQSLMSTGDTTTSASVKGTNPKQLSKHDTDFLNPQWCTLVSPTHQPHSKQWWTTSIMTSYSNMNHWERQFASIWTISSDCHWYDKPAWVPGRGGPGTGTGCHSSTQGKPIPEARVPMGNGHWHPVGSCSHPLATLHPSHSNCHTVWIACIFWHSWASHGLPANSDSDSHIACHRFYWFYCFSISHPSCHTHIHNLSLSLFFWLLCLLSLPCYFPSPCQWTPPQVPLQTTCRQAVHSHVLCHLCLSPPSPHRIAHITYAFEYVKSFHPSIALATLPPLSLAKALGLFYCHNLIFVWLVCVLLPLPLSMYLTPSIPHLISVSQSSLCSYRPRILSLCHSLFPPNLHLLPYTLDL